MTTIAGRDYTDFDFADQRLQNKEDYKSSVITGEVYTHGITMQEAHILLVHEEGASRKGGEAMANYLTERFGGEDSTIQRGEWAEMEEMSMNDLALLAHYDTDLNGGIDFDELSAKLNDQTARNIFNDLGLGLDESIGVENLGELRSVAPIMVFAGEVHSIDAASGGTGSNKMSLAAIILWLIQNLGDESDVDVDQVLQQLNIPADQRAVLESLGSAIQSDGTVKLTADQAKFLLNDVGLKISGDRELVSALETVASMGSAAGSDPVLVGNGVDGEQLMRALVRNYEVTGGEVGGGASDFINDNVEQSANGSPVGNNSVGNGGSPASEGVEEAPQGSPVGDANAEDVENVEDVEQNPASPLVSARQHAEVLRDNIGLIDMAAGIGRRDNLFGRGDLKAIADDPILSQALRDAATFFLSSKASFNQLDVASNGGNLDGLVSSGDLNDFIKASPAETDLPVPTTGREAAVIIRDNFALFDTALGVGKRDGLIGRGDLSAVAKDTNLPDYVREAAKLMLNSKATFNQADVASQGGNLDGLISKGDLGAFISRTPDVKDVAVPTTGKEAAQIISDNFGLFDLASGVGRRDGLIGSGDLSAVANDTNLPDHLREAARILLTSKATFNQIDVASQGGNLDGLIGRGDLAAYLK